MNEDPHRIVADAAGAVGQISHDELTALPALLQSSSGVVDCAKAYARCGLRVVALHSVLPNGECTCGNPKCAPKKRGKHPRLKRGVYDATTDPRQIEGWQRRWGDLWNVGIATGNGLVCVDLDSPEQIQQFAEIAKQHGGIPPTMVVQTGRGAHFYFAGQLQGSRTVQGILFRGSGGYIVGAPSKHASGRIYQVVRNVAPANLPGWLNEFIHTAEKTAHGATNNAQWSHGLDKLGPKPDYLKRAPRKILLAKSARI
jgi:hypothetical protein